MKDLIERLQDKDYVRAFGLMSWEEQECFRKVGKKNCLFYNGDAWLTSTGNKFTKDATYAIKPDYQPELEYVDLVVISLACADTGRQGVKWLGVSSASHSFLPHNFTHLHCLPCLPNFEGFYTEDDIGFVGNLGKYLFLCEVARKISKGKKTYARFRK